jgi:signal transduction histidine kinase
LRSRKIANPRQWLFIAYVCLFVFTGLSPAQTALTAGFIDDVVAGADEGSRLPKHVLLFYSDNVRLPFSQEQDKVFRESLSSMFPGIVIYSENLDSSLNQEDTPTKLAADFYRQKYQNIHFDVVVAIKPSALGFLLSHPDAFGGAPVVFCNVSSIDKLLERLTPGVVGVEVEYSLLPSLTLIRELQPETSRVVVIVGASAREAGAPEILRKQTEGLSNTLPIDYWVGLPPSELKTRLSELTSKNAVIYISEIRDTDGHIFVPRDFLQQIAPFSKAPIYSISTTYLDTGSIGGRLIDPNTDARMAVGLVERILNGEDPQTLKSVIEPTRDIFDARVLKRFGIPEWRLPAESVVLFREPDIWQKYKPYFLLALAAVFLQLLLIVALALEGRRRKKLGAELKDLSRRLIDAQESERRRIARELHDDLNQRVVLLQSHLERLGVPENRGTVFEGQVADLSREAREISTGISHLSHQLHSSALDILGLEPALRGLTRDMSLAYDLNIAFFVDGQSIPLTPEIELCLFRVAQESLSNVVKHSGASAAQVNLSYTGSNKIVRLAITDNGGGFDPRHPKRDSLGIISMRERLRLVDGELIISSSDEGTEVIAHVKITRPRVLAAHG